MSSYAFCYKCGETTRHNESQCSRCSCYNGSARNIKELTEDSDETEIEDLRDEDNEITSE